MRRFVLYCMLLGSMTVMPSCRTPAPKAEVLKPVSPGDLPAQGRESATSAQHTLGVYDVKGTVESTTGSGWELVTLQTRIPDGAQLRVGPDSETTLLDPGRTVWRLDHAGVYRVQFNPEGAVRWRVFSIPAQAP